MSATDIATRIACVLILSISALALGSGSAAAEEPKLNVEGASATPSSTGLIMPEIEQVDIQFEFYVQIPALQACTFDITLEFQYVPNGEDAYSSAVLAPRQRVISVEGTEVVPGQPSVPYANTESQRLGPFTTTLTVSFDRNVPAFNSVVFTVKGQARTSLDDDDGCSIQDSDWRESSASIKPAYFASLSVQPVNIVQDSGQNKRVLFPVQITNFGNGATNVETKIDNVSGGLDTVNAPPRLTLESRANRGDQAQMKDTVFLTVMSPAHNGYENKVYSFNAKFRASPETSETGSHMTREIVVPFTLKVQGVYVPGFDSVSLIAALGVGLLGLTRMRRRVA